MSFHKGFKSEAEAFDYAREKAKKYNEEYVMIYTHDMEKGMFFIQNYYSPKMILETILFEGDPHKLLNKELLKDK